MLRRRFLAATLAPLTVPVLYACGSDTKPRCAECGMLLDLDPRFAAGAKDADGKVVHFDTPKCLFRYLTSDRGARATDAWVKDYYDQQRLDAAGAVYVVGTEIHGPMGRDLLPVRDADAAKQLIGDHGGREVRFAEIDGKLLAGID